MFTITQCKKYFDEHDVEYEEHCENVLAVQISDDGIVEGNAWLSFNIVFDDNGKFLKFMIEE